jgi:hypothetical protein
VSSPLVSTSRRAELIHEYSVPIVAIIRLVNIYRILYLGEKSKHHNLGYVWTAVEVNLAVICCCMPALRPLGSRWFPKLFGTDQSKSGDQPYINNRYGGSSHIASGVRNKSHTRESHYALKDLGSSWKQSQRTEIRGTSPSGSEEEIMTYNGILRTTNVNVTYEGKRSDRGSRMSSEAA